LIQLPATLALAKAVSLLKANSSGWMSEHGIRYGAFSVSASNIDKVVRYIRDQEKHHRRRTFEQEFVAMLKKHGIEFDPKYVFG